MSRAHAASPLRTLAAPEARSGERGFTLTELMAVVAIIGILATLGLAMIRRNVTRSNVSSAVVIVKSIAAAQEQYRALNQVYLNVSSDDDEQAWYPSKTIPRNHSHSFYRADDSETKKWRALGPDIRQPVDFAFKANAGLPGEALPTLATSALTLPSTSPSEPWYLIQARADADADGTPCVVVAASWSREVFTANEGE